ncbi:MAG: phosphopantothenoylcysteine decarboxylase [Kiritimatiellaceae bacterium]|nr:phosphopantothenoylcysteine decarboxylase [Kiritimatiellaceae bacterium]
MNKSILILSGPTHEYIDPVRFIGNSSSGQMGKAIAEKAAEEGYIVTFVTGPVADANLPNLGKSGSIHSVISAEEMLSKASDFFSTSDIIIFTAAVADYAPANKLAEKMTKSEKDLVLKLRPTPDIAKMLCAKKRTDQIAIGFALQTSEGKKNARCKLVRKNLDGIVLNTPASLGAETGTFSFLSSSAEEFNEWGRITKKECALNIFQTLENLTHGK